MDKYVKVIGYREFEKTDPITKKTKIHTKQEYFESEFNFKDHADLFKNLDMFLNAQIPRAERYNLHYTIHHMPKGSKDKKTVDHIEVIPLDIDHIILGKAEEYVALVEEVFRIKRDSFVSIMTGNGLQFLFLLDTEFSEHEWLSLKASYVLKCQTLDQMIKDNNLYQKIDEDKATGCDVGIFRIGTMRLPGTLNVKKGKDPKKCGFITKELEPVTLETLGLYFETKNKDKKIKPKDRAYLGTQSDYIFKECPSLASFKKKKGNVSYAQWFNAISVVARFNDVDGIKMAHDLSKGHADYDADETQNLIDSTLESGGPATCTTFAYNYDSCKGCKYLKTKLKSPINLREKSFLPHEHTGFHKQVQSGNDWVWKPVYKELVEKFKQEHEYVSLEKSEEIFAYDEKDNYWKVYSERKLLYILKKYTHSKPGDYPRSSVFTEALNHIGLEQVVNDVDFFEASSNKVNFLNGHIEIRGTEVKFLPKSKDSLRYKFLFALPYNFEPEAKCPTFDKFIFDICSNDELRALGLMEYIGYLISNDTYWAHKFLMLEGDGSNGKSVLLALIRKLCGEGNYSSLKIEDLKNEQQRFNLLGKMANICDEIDKGTLLKSGEVKNLTAGGHFTYKQVYAKPGEAVNRAKFIFSTNHGFSSNDSSHGLLRRYFPIVLDQMFIPKSEATSPLDKIADPYILDNMLEELPGIWNKCMNKYLEAKKRKEFTSNQATKSRLTEFKESSNPIGTYLADHISFLSEDAYENSEVAKEYAKTALNKEDVNDSVYEEFTFIPINDIRKDFNSWQEDRGNTSNYSVATFSKLLKTELKKVFKSSQALDVVFTRKRVKGVRNPVFLCKWRPFSSII